MSRRGPDLAGRVIRALGASRRGPLAKKDLARRLRLRGSAVAELDAVLDELMAAGRIYRVKGGRYGVPDDLGLASGVISLTRAGDGFVRREEGDVFVAASRLGGAMHGDRVVARIERNDPRGPAGSVIKVLRRAHETVVGTFHPGRRLSRVLPLDRRVQSPVMIPAGVEKAAADGDVVVARITAYGDGLVAPVGEVERVLGPLSDPGVDVLAIVHGYGLPLEFPPNVLAAADAAVRRGLADPGANRVDRTGLHVVTIDPADAKDHDDALSLTELGEGRFEVGVHIADVAHFVRPGDPVDVEARRRGTSVYLVDRTIPMLPEALSGDVCSLHEGEVRFALSLFVELDRAGRVHARRYERTSIRSRGSLTYEQVQAALNGSGSIDPATDEALRVLDDLARALRALRRERGALDLELPEARVVLDEAGLPVDILRVARLESHRLIEDFMILANEVVAGDSEAGPLPVLYRVHEPPSREGRERIAELLASYGDGASRRAAARPRDLQRLLDAVAGRPEEQLVAMVVLRSLERARYHPTNLGHFGLASPAYLHFTSPIRRYPDLVVHRQIGRSLVDGAPPDEEVDADALAELALEVSERERAADEAERDSVALKKVEFMERHLGEDFDGHVSGVTAFGFFVTLDDVFVDGLVHVNSLRDDFYRLDARAHALVGRRGRRHRLGDRVRIQVARVDKEARHVDFALVRKLPAPRR